MKRLLVIGNGFDLAHGLRTSYFDFLYSCCLISGRKFNGNNYDSDNFPIKSRIIKALGQYEKIIRFNKWINYFLDVVDKLKPGWIDLEREIEEVCKHFKEIKGKEYIIETNADTIKNISRLTYDGRHIDLNGLKDEYRDLIEVLDAYLKSATSTNKIGYYPQVLHYSPDYVVNFNYTNTYSRIYSDKARVDYVHGQLSDVKSKRTLVLGFNNMNNIKNDITYAEFIKYYQMVKNKVNINIFDELNKYENYNVKYEVMVFGHSLDKTDKDILKSIIQKADKVTIIYHSEEAMSNKIKSLIELYEEKEVFIKDCFKSNNKITFLEQDKIVVDKEKYNSIRALNKYLQMDEINHDFEFTEIKEYCLNDLLELRAEDYLQVLELVCQYVKHAGASSLLTTKERNRLKEIVSSKINIKDNMMYEYPGVYDLVNGNTIVYLRTQDGQMKRM